RLVEIPGAGALLDEGPLKMRVPVHGRGETLGAGSVECQRGGTASAEVKVAVDDGTAHEEGDGVGKIRHMDAAVDDTLMNDCGRGIDSRYTKHTVCIKG